MKKRPSISKQFFHLITCKGIAKIFLALFQVNFFSLKSKEMHRKASDGHQNYGTTKLRFRMFDYY
jgi:hypothetical protein